MPSMVLARVGGVRDEQPMAQLHRSQWVSVQAASSAARLTTLASA